MLCLSKSELETNWLDILQCFSKTLLMCAVCCTNINDFKEMGIWFCPARTDGGLMMGNEELLCPISYFLFQHVSTCLPVCEKNWKNSVSHSPGWQLLFVDSSQSFGSALDHLALGHACHCLMPVCSVDVGQAALQDLTHWNNQTWPAQAVVRRGQGLSLHRESYKNSLMSCWRNWVIVNKVSEAEADICPHQWR